MIIKGALTMVGGGKREGGDEDLRYYLICPLRKGRPRIAVTVCHKQKLASDGGKVKCGYGVGALNITPLRRPKVKKIERDGVV